MNTILLLLIAATALLSFKGFNDTSFFSKYEFHVGKILSGQKIRMLSSGFLHADVNHLFFNMLTLFFFAPVVIAYFGNGLFLLVYLVSLAAGSFLTLFFHKNNYSYRAIGASGAVTGILYSAILLQPNMTIGIFFILPMPAYIFGILYLFYSIYGMRAQNDGIGHTAHFGGAIGGYAITLLLKPQIVAENPLFVGLLALPIVVLFVLEKVKKSN